MSNWTTLTNIVSKISITLKVLILKAFFAAKGENFAYNQKMEFQFDFKSLSEKIIESQGLEGLMYSLSPQNLSENVRSKFKNKWMQQWGQNQLLWSELCEIDKLLIDISIRPILLKGMSFLNRLYKDFGSRKISDIDLYLHPKDAHHFIELLRLRGFVEINRNVLGEKIVLSKALESTEVVLEIHTKLFSHIDKTFAYQGVEVLGLQCFKSLPLEEEFVYLCYHLAHQHTFLKLQWPLDLVLFIKKYPDLNYDKIIALSSEFESKKSVMMVLWILRKFFKVSIPHKELEDKISNMDFPLGINFLLAPKENIFKYIWIKNLTKDGPIHSIKDSFRAAKDFLFH